MAEAIKTQRAQTKKQVTRSVRKLKSALQLGADTDKIVKEANDLEDCFGILNDLHMEYEEMTGIEDQSYLEKITEDYNNSMKLYYNAIKEEKEIKIKRETAPLMASIERGFNKIETGIESLNEVNAGSLDVHVVMVDKEDLDVL